MKNKLIIREEVKPDNTLTYVVEDNYTVYMLTGNLACAEELVRNLKLEYNREKQNAS
jgi:hypothetical protein|tara:strand:+ start:2025 stop:2195 length:171 start_codon:yes stop_codon:yes gene_type:complete